ncbi:MAG: hypothetical protein ACOYD7_08450 [Raoultibacter sp.]|jgi:hypothetical protein
MENQGAKEKRIKRMPINRFRRIALYINPVVLLILVFCIFFGAPTEACIAVGVTGYGAFFYFLIRANLEDRKIHGN